LKKQKTRQEAENKKQKTRHVLTFDKKTWRSGTFTGTTWPNPSGGDTISWTIDPATGAATAKNYPNSTSVGYTYNARGQVKTRTWARGVTTTYNYNSLTGELTGKTYSDSTPAVSFTYNRFGALHTVTDAAGTRSFAYHANLNLNTETLPAFYGSTTLTMTYDGSVPGRVVGYSFNGNVPIALTRAYDSLGRVSSVTGKYNSTNTTFTMDA
jgi:YD repeat-containing protein